MTQTADIIVVGAGAAGLTASIFAAEHNKQVLLLERNPQAGRKILMSGGTRCNVLPEVVTPDDFTTGSSINILRNILKSWPVDECKHWFERVAGIRLKLEPETRKFFPESNAAKDVRDQLVRLAVARGVKMVYQTCIRSLYYKNDCWNLADDHNRLLTAKKVIIATGGKSYPKTGTDGTGYRLASSLGHTVRPLYPALTPLIGPHPGDENLSGLSLPVTISANLAHGKSKNKTKDSSKGFLFTHKGYSGPAILDIAHTVIPHLQADSDHTPTLYVNWANQSRQWWESLLHGKTTTELLLQKHLPKRLAQALLSETGLSGKKVAELNKQERAQFLESLCQYTLQPKGYMGFEKAEVTGGGIPLEEVRPASMESRCASGLHLCGEMLDVFGRIGGFNFYWAWVTGRLAGMHT
ncbi:aminoacetone oxidase family FAD-binding enzyme [Balneolaceae bacterium ANBcel3]|nr:aminoacetone oxidase family FAD-binding enzyme [Balneolaceae bacterium ANBcel3]